MSATIETTLLNNIKTVLSDFPEYWDRETLLKSKVIEDLRSYDEKIITALLNNEKIKETYALSVGDMTIFKVEEFIEMLRYKNYWDNSYTKYRNEIGLTSDGKYLNYNTDVVLDFPFKDCVLEGGMSSEDEGKKEVYYHNVIAKEEIDTLLSPKVLTNLKKYDKDGEHEVNKFNEDDNLIIKGNNLLALHSLKERYAGKVKMIYIDPPYYFKSNIGTDTFLYNSKFKLSSWLTFMENRLNIAKQLLNSHGTIWINISEDGMHYLKVLADSIFGNEKFVGTIPRKTRDGKSDVPYNLSQDFDWILVYSAAKSSEYVVGREVSRKYYNTPDFPERPWRVADMTSQRTVKERPNSNFTMINPKTGKKYEVNPKRSWAVTKDTFNEYYNNGGIGFPDDYDFMKGNRPFRRIFKEDDDANEKPSAVYSDFLLKDFMSTILTKSKNKAGNDEINEIFTRDDFDYAKPEKLISSIVDISTNENDIVLDFFMGSATTQAVAMKMNRQFIGVEQMDYINTVSVPRLQKVIEGEQGGISKDVDWQGGRNFVYAELDSLNQQYIDKLNEITSEEEVESILEEMKSSAYLNFKVELNKVTTDSEDFSALSLDDKKKVLLDVLDMNQLYLNYSEIDDTQYDISEEVKQFNHSFYGQGGE